MRPDRVTHAWTLSPVEVSTLRNRRVGTHCNSIVSIWTVAGRHNRKHPVVTCPVCQHRMIILLNDLRELLGTLKPHEQDRLEAVSSAIARLERLLPHELKHAKKQ